MRFSFQKILEVLGAYNPDNGSLSKCLSGDVRMCGIIFPFDRPKELTGVQHI